MKIQIVIYDERRFSTMNAADIHSLVSGQSLSNEHLLAADYTPAHSL